MKETEFLLIAPQNKPIQSKYIKPKVQQISQYNVMIKIKLQII